MARYLCLARFAFLCSQQGHWACDHLQEQRYDSRIDKERQENGTGRVKDKELHDRACLFYHVGVSPRFECFGPVPRIFVKDELLERVEHRKWEFYQKKAIFRSLVAKYGTKLWEMEMEFHCWFYMAVLGIPMITLNLWAPCLMSGKLFSMINWAVENLIGQ